MSTPEPPPPPPPPPPTVAPTSGPLLVVVYADADIAVVDKPSGLLSCPGRDASRFDSVQTRVPLVWPEVTGSILAHRLDQATSGLMVVALSPSAHSALRKQFEARTVHKTYEAVVVGDAHSVDGTDVGTITLPFRLDVDRRPLQIYDPVHGKVGITRFRIVARDGGRSRVLFEPLTGRTHQLRVHAAHPLGLGCPIAGDPLYGDATAAPRLLLHASTLGFIHPVTNLPLQFHSETPF